MAQIDMGQFGFAVAEPQRPVFIPSETGTRTAAAIGNIGQAGQKIAATLQDAEDQRQRMQAASSLATLNNDLYDIHDEIGRGVADGSISPQQAMPEFQRRAAEARKARTEGLTPQQIEVMDPQIIRSTGALQRNLEGVAFKRTQEDIGASIFNAGEQFQRTAMRDLPGSIKQYDGIVDTMGPQAGWNATQIAKAKQGFKETATYNFANAALEGAAQTGDVSLIIAARQKIEGPEGEAIDPAKRTALITKAYAYENGAQASLIREQEKAQRELEARENKARTAYGDAQELMLNGRYLSTEYLSQLADVTAGTSVAPAVQELVRSQSEVAGFASLSVQQQQALIERRRAAGSTPSVGTDPAAEKLTNTMQRISDATVKAYNENPWQAAQERGVIQDAPVVSINNIQDAQATLSTRMQEIDRVEAAAGRRVSPLQPQEAETIGRVIRSLPPDQQSTALAAFGDTVGNADRVAAMARQIDAKDKVLGTAMMFANAKTTQGRYVSELVLRGERAIRDNTVKPDSAKESGWRAQIAAEIGDAYTDQEVRERMIDAAYFIKAGLTADGTVKDDIRRAVALATGGIHEQRDGTKVPLPYGMTEDQFESRMQGIQAADLAGQTPDGNVYIGRTAVPVAQFLSQLPNASLVHAGQGRYNVRAGTGLVTNSAGQRILIEVRP